MHKRIITAAVVLLIGFTLFALNKGFKQIAFKKSNTETKGEDELYMNGDLIFQTNVSGQGLAIQQATKSKYTHVGILFKSDGRWKVYEAVEPVRSVSLEEFITRGDSGHYLIKRLQNRDSLLQSGQLALMKSFLEQQLNKHYDPYFAWSESEMYCSELVWKCYQKAGIKLCDLRRLKSFDLSSPLVKAIMKERYGKNIPYEETVVSPGDIQESKALTDVVRK